MMILIIAFNNIGYKCKQSIIKKCNIFINKRDKEIRILISIENFVQRVKSNKQRRIIIRQKFGWLSIYKITIKEKVMYNNGFG
ncbi:unnamed protein product [Paramecium sonneborni]|uniref:Uncharacterized protein n=1 Tax=Paramecium sonneborni TaxID=65129 RepID=A0A8S1R382_9CILI|nr:unnamed protein product [Paramecium sonneborni]